MRLNYGQGWNKGICDSIIMMVCFALHQQFMGLMRLIIVGSDLGLGLMAMLIHGGQRMISMLIGN
jgi:hypothetical protein